MKKALIGIVILAGLVGVACSKKGEAPAPAAAPAAEAPAPAAMAAPLPVEAPTPEPPATLTDVNVAAADRGGGVEELPGNQSDSASHVNYGPGLTGRRLIDGQVDKTWLTPEGWYGYWMFEKDGWAKYPVDAVLSFYEHQPALVGAVTLVAPDAMSVELLDDTSTAPKDVEVWTAMDNAPEKFVRVASATFEPTPGEHTIEFPAKEARFVKLRVLSGASPRVLELAEVRVLEATREGYVPLFTREPGALTWKGSPREAAQRGLEWLQQAGNDWGAPQPCFGCHVQAQALMGQAVALKQGYRVSMPALRAFADLVHGTETPEGTWAASGFEFTPSVFGAMALTYAAEVTGKTSDPQLLKALDYVLSEQASDGAIPEGTVEPPILQGSFMMTANALVAIKWAAAHSRDPRYAPAAARSLAWIASHDPETTQDKVFKIVALMHYGTPEQRRMAWSVVEGLAAEQQPDGGWKEVAGMEGSNAFATGQVLYAFKQAGVSVQSPMFKRGVDYLLQGQINESVPENGSWKAVHTQSERKSVFAPTMWAVIGLAGAYGTDPKGALQIVKQGDKSAGRNLEIVLDVSGSMNTKLGESTRWDTALAVLKEVVSTCPKT